MKRGEIYWMKVPVEENHIQNGKRLWVVVQNDVGNKVSPTTIVCPITSVLKKVTQPTHVLIEKVLPKKSMVICEQIMTVDKKELYACVGNLTERQMEKVDRALAISLGLNEWRDNDERDQPVGT